MASFCNWEIFWSLGVDGRNMKSCTLTLSTAPCAHPPWHHDLPSSTGGVAASGTFPPWTPIKILSLKLPRPYVHQGSESKAYGKYMSRVTSCKWIFFLQDTFSLLQHHRLIISFLWDFRPYPVQFLPPSSYIKDGCPDGRRSLLFRVLCYCITLLLKPCVISKILTLYLKPFKLKVHFNIS